MLVLLTDFAISFCKKVLVSSCASPSSKFFPSCRPSCPVRPSGPSLIPLPSSFFLSCPFFSVGCPSHPVLFFFWLPASSPCFWLPFFFLFFGCLLFWGVVFFLVSPRSCPLVPSPCVLVVLPLLIWLLHFFNIFKDVRFYPILNFGHF